MRRFTIAVLWLSVGWPCLGADLPSDAVYANFFTDTANLNLYLRYLGAMESAQRDAAGADRPICPATDGPLFAHVAQRGSFLWTSRRSPSIEYDSVSGILIRRICRFFSKCD